MNLIEKIEAASVILKDIISETPLSFNFNISNEFSGNIFLKREDLQIVRSYKIRGAYNKMYSLTSNEKSKGVVCASAGNHAQGFAYACNLLNVFGSIYMPKTTPLQKIKQVELFGKNFIEIILIGDFFDDAYQQAMIDASENNKIFIHPFDDELVIAGQGTVAKELLSQSKNKIDYLFIPIGGGGLAAGVCSYFKKFSPETKLIGVEPLGAAAMKLSIQKNQNTPLDNIDKFVDGAAVKRVGEITFEICKNLLDDIILVPEGKVCTTILKLYNEEAMVVEPAGALTIAALDFYKEKLKGKEVVCIVSGSNNDILRTEEIKERSLLYEGLKHYFLIQFPQRPGALKDFVTNIIGEKDDITSFQFQKKNNREQGPALIGLELKNKNDLQPIFNKLNEMHFQYTYINDDINLYNQLIG